jgi:hypothetical protein
MTWAPAPPAGGRVSARAQRVAQITALKARGLTHRQIGEELGIGASTIRNLLNDPDGLKERARKLSYRGTCIDCGGPTDGGDGRAKAALRCRWCVRGIPVGSPLRPTARRTLPVRLSDLPLEVRLTGAREANRVERGDVERTEILLAALEPSETVYWLAESARPLLECIVAEATAA